MRHLTLSTKVILLVLLPLGLQLALLVYLAYLQNSAEEQLKQALKAKRITDAINRLSGDVYGTASKVSDEDAFNRPLVDFMLLRDLKNRSEKNFAELKELTHDDAKLYPIVVDAEESTQNVHRTAMLLRAMKKEPGQGEETARVARKPLWKKLRNDLHHSLFNGLLPMAQDQQRKAEILTVAETRSREQFQTMALIGGVVNVLGTFLAAVLVTKSISSRLKILNENTYRLASNLPLRQPIGGNDELTRLDQVFHKMATAIQEAARKERAIVENARDFICTINGAGRITAANSSCEALLGRKPNEVIGTYFAEYIFGDRTQATEFMKSLKTHVDPPPIELLMKQADGEMIYTTWSAHWSSEEDAAFCVIHDISDRRRAELLRKEVVAMITHDLRTPLSTLNNVIKLVSSGRFGSLDDKGRDYLNMGVNNIHKMSSLVNDLLDIEKIDAGGMKLDCVPMVVDECFDACLASMSAFAEAHEVELVADPADFKAYGDEEKVDRVIANLVGNAVKFSPKGGIVRLSAEVLENEICICVSDQGKGIPPDEIETVFKRFHQVEGTEQKHGGSGLGLTICKAFVELHSGRIWVESTVGKGSQFKFTLPKKSQSPANDERDDHAGTSHDEPSSKEFADSDVSLPSTATSAQGASTVQVSESVSQKESAANEDLS